MSLLKKRKLPPSVYDEIISAVAGFRDDSGYRIETTTRIQSSIHRILQRHLFLLRKKRYFLPNEIMFEIFQFAPTSTWKNCLFVSKIWSALIRASFQPRILSFFMKKHQIVKEKYEKDFRKNLKKFGIFRMMNCLMQERNLRKISDYDKQYYEKHYDFSILHIEREFSMEFYYSHKSIEYLNKSILINEKGEFLEIWASINDTNDISKYGGDDYKKSIEFSVMYEDKKTEKFELKTSGHSGNRPKNIKIWKVFVPLISSFLSGDNQNMDHAQRIIAELCCSQSHTMSNKGVINSKDKDNYELIHGEFLEEWLHMQESVEKCGVFQYLNDQRSKSNKQHFGFL